MASSPLPILVLGDTGVGKEGIARAVHASSSRRDGPFVALSCAAIPSDLLEAELFGIARGVATGIGERQGKFQAAAGGTLFLDEVGEMLPSLQAKLLRALQEQEVTPVGGRPLAIDVRIVAATNIQLAARLDDGSFRRDLYYRLAGALLRVPPLSERRDDIPALVESFLRRAAATANHAVRGLTRGALEALVEHPWPGNVRQLRHTVERLVFQAAEAQILDEGMVRSALSQDLDSGKVGDLLGDELNLDALERRAIVTALERSAGHQIHAAELLGISRTALYRRLRKHRLSAD